MVSINKEVLMHPDFRCNYKDVLCDYLNSLIDSELEKDDPNFDFIDECADAINAIRENFADAVLPLISKKEFYEKLGITINKTPKITIAVAVAVMALFAANFVIASATDYNILNEIKEGLIDLFTKDEEEPTTARVRETTTREVKTTKPETTTKAETTLPTTESTTKRQKIEQGIKAESGDNFRTEYNVGESFDSNDLKVILFFDDGSTKRLGKSEYEISVPSDFGKSAGYETIKITYKDLVCDLKVRILNTKATPLLTSVYATFPSGYDFTTEDIDNVDLSSVKVFAVYSDGNEKELSVNEYTINQEDISTFFEKKVLITITYQSCASSFTVFEK